MIKKITILLFFAIAILPATFNNAYAQNYATEGMPQEDGSIDYYHRVDYTYGPSEWVYDYTVVPSQVDWCDCSDEPHPDDPTSQPDWGYPDWAEMEDYLNYLDEMIGDPYSYENTWGGTYDSTSLKYYVTVDGKPEKYYDRSTFNFAKKSRGKARFTLGVLGGSLSEPGLRWKVNGVVKTSFNNDKEMWLPLDTKATYNVEVWEESIRKYIGFTVTVFGNPSVFFHRKNNYAGEYGFDNFGYIHDSLKNHYQTILVDSQDYHVPWVSLLDGQTATIKITSTITAEAASDTSTWVEFRPSASGKIKINGDIIPVRKRGSELATFNSINIEANELDPIWTNYKQDSIIVISNTGDTVGKLMVSCQKPIQKKVAFIYVNSGSGYRRSISKDSLLEQLNARSHNQIFKKYVLRNDLPDTLNVTGQYIADSAYANSHIQVWLNLKYKAAYFPSIISIGDLNLPHPDSSIYFAPTNPNRTYLYYITDINISANTLGETRPSSSISTIVLCGLANTRYRIMETTSHEMGHAIGLEHTFYDPLEPPTYFCPHIAKYSLTNFMDYGRDGLDPEKDCFYYYQWLYSNYY